MHLENSLARNSSLLLNLTKTVFCVMHIYIYNIYIYIYKYILSTKAICICYCGFAVLFNAYCFAMCLAMLRIFISCICESNYKGLSKSFDSGKALSLKDNILLVNNDDPENGCIILELYNEFW